MKARVAVLLSGRGSNFLALQKAVASGEIPAEIVLVVSDRAEAPGLAKARQLGLETLSVVRQKGQSRVSHEEPILEALRTHRVEWICLAGFMRILSPSFIASYPNRILNIHPSLLPAFPGLHAQRQALEYGVAISGCTVHLVDEGLDSGPIVVQRAVELREGETEDSLAARILEQEHSAYPLALKGLLEKAWEIQGRRVLFFSAAKRNFEKSRQDA